MTSFNTEGLKNNSLQIMAYLNHLLRSLVEGGETSSSMLSV